MRLLMLLVLVGLITACTPPGDLIRQTQTVEGVTITLEAADGVRINMAQEFFITLADASGTPISDAAVYLDLDMPAMPMAVNRPVADSLGDGRYRAESAYTMAGEWEIVVVAVIDGVEYRAVFMRDAIL